jgi:ABC transporter substrate binding protein
MFGLIEFNPGPRQGAIGSSRFFVRNGFPLRHPVICLPGKSALGPMPAYPELLDKMSRRYLCLIQVTCRAVVVSALPSRAWRAAHRETCHAALCNGRTGVFGETASRPDHAQHRLPAVYPTRDFAAAGGLISYGADFIAQYRQAAGYVDRILTGENPANLPVQAPTKYELIINLKTARAFGLTVPDNLLALADEVIE